MKEEDKGILELIKPDPPTPKWLRRIGYISFFVAYYGIPYAIRYLKSYF